MRAKQRPRSAHGADAEIIVTRSQYTVTFVRGDGRRHIQVILHAYSHAAEALVHFDVDCCAVAYDGARVVATPRGRRAIEHRLNILDVGLASPTYERRLEKYAERGFAVLVPGMQREKLDSDILNSVHDIDAARRQLRRVSAASDAWFGGSEMPIPAAVSGLARTAARLIQS